MKRLLVYLLSFILQKMSVVSKQFLKVQSVKMSEDFFIAFPHTCNVLENNTI